MHLLLLWLATFLKSNNALTPEELELLAAGPDIMIDG